MKGGYESAGEVAERRLRDQIAEWDSRPWWTRAWRRLRGRYSGREELSQIESMKTKWGSR